VRKKETRKRARALVVVLASLKEEGKRRGFEKERDDDDENIFAFIYYIEREREKERFTQHTMSSSRRKSRPPKRVHFELAEIAAQHIIREREQELKRRREEQKSLMSVTSFNDAVVAAVAKGWDAAAEVETVEDDLRKKAKVVKVRLLEGGGTAKKEEEEEEEKEDSSDRFCAFVEGGKCTTALLERAGKGGGMKDENKRLCKFPKDFLRLREEEDEANEEITEEERRVSMKAYARKRCCKSCYNALYRSMRKELQMGSNKDEMLLDNPSDEIVIAQQQQRKPSVKDKVFAPTRTYFCSRCNLECSSRYHLRTHERTHTGDRPYGCNVCGRRFNRPYEWKVHVLKHATNGRHKEVARAFEQNLELGMEKVNGDPGVQSLRPPLPQRYFDIDKPPPKDDANRPFQCAICFKAFATNFILTAHLKTHLNTRHVCDMCDASYTRKFKLQAHREKVHGVSSHEESDRNTDGEKESESDSQS
jgi:hypothetical protein